MGIKPYLILNLHQTRYAIAAEAVTEIFLLPELNPVAEAPPDVVGLLNLHSKFVPVMHLDLRFGHKFEQCHLTDSVVVVESQQLQVGIIVHQVETVSDIDDRYIQSDLCYGREQNINQAFIKGAIDLDDEMILLLNIDNLVRHRDALGDLLDSEDANVQSEISNDNFYERYFAEANFKTREILHRRAVDLKQTTDDASATELMSIAVISIQGRYFGFDLSVVREFTNLKQVTTIPCCPEHIVGNMNLRGEILTLIDISQTLNLTSSDRPAIKAVVIEVDEITAGIVVEEVYDVVDFRLEELKPVPVATYGNSANYLKGIANYQNQTLNVIDLPKLIAEGAMTVELTT